MKVGGGNTVLLFVLKYDTVAVDEIVQLDWDVVEIQFNADGAMLVYS